MGYGRGGAATARPTLHPPPAYRLSTLHSHHPSNDDTQLWKPNPPHRSTSSLEGLRSSRSLEGLRSSTASLDRTSPLSRTRQGDSRYVPLWTGREGHPASHFSREQQWKFDATETETAGTYRMDSTYDRDLDRFAMRVILDRLDVGRAHIPSSRGVPPHESSREFAQSRPRTTFGTTHRYSASAAFPAGVEGYNFWDGSVPTRSITHNRQLGSDRKVLIETAGGVFVR